jgi:hypothetical protein
MIDAIMTGLTGRISSLNKVQPIRPVKQEQESEPKAPQSLDNLSLSKEALELYDTVKVKEPANTELNSEQQQSQGELTEEQQKEVDELKARDKEVRAHEQAHMTSGAPYTSAPKYEYTTGPDNQQYATGGSVDIDTSEESTPEKTLQKAQVIKRSAQAPAEPSSQDKKVAAEAAQMERQARAEIAEQKQTEPTNQNSFGISQYMKQMSPAYIGSSLQLQA